MSVEKGVVPSVDVPNINWNSIKFKKTQYVSQLVDTYGKDILFTKDKSGLFPIHWAIIHGNFEIVEQMLEMGVSPRLKTQINEEPEPIHMAALEGQIKIIDLLLLHGADIDVKDRTGCTPLLRAAMFGRNYKTKSSETVLHLISCGADPKQIDIYGNTALIYAILQNNEDSVHLLLNLGLDPNQSQNRGALPFDFAKNTGNEYLMRLLGPLTHGITRTDLELMIIKHKESKLREKFNSFLLCLARIIVLLAVFSTILYAYPQYILYYLPKTSSDIVFHILFFVLNAFVWISWYMTCGSDPGYLPTNTAKYKKVLDSKVESGLHYQTFGKRVRDPYEDIRLCHTCRTVQSNRSTHCRFCKRCTASFDHHCIYLSTCIGQNNRIWFFSLGVNMFLLGSLTAYKIITFAQSDGTVFEPYHWFNMCFGFQFAFIGFCLTLCNIRRAAINLTQNEEFKSRRYSYLTDSEGRFVNPFDRGSYFRNIFEYFTTKRCNYSKMDTYEC